MKPPICAVCGVLGGGGAAVQFPVDPAERAAWDQFVESGGVGHPPGLVWYCGEHLAQGRAEADAAQG